MPQKDGDLEGATFLPVRKRCSQLGKNGFAPSSPLGQISPLIICGPNFEHCELTRAGICAVQMRGLPILEKWKNLRDSGLCLGIENARAVDRLNKLMGLDTFTLARGDNITLEKFVEWAQSKRSIELPQKLLDTLNRDTRMIKKHEHFSGEDSAYNAPNTQTIAQNITYNISGNNARINQNSVDNSSNIINQIDPEVNTLLNDLRIALGKSSDGSFDVAEKLVVVGSIEQQLLTGKPDKTIVSALLNALPTTIESITNIANNILGILFK